jgi:hypothetical protein
VLASNLYAADENWGHVVDVRVDMGVNKETASYSTGVSSLKSMEKKMEKASLLRSTSNFRYYEICLRYNREFYFLLLASTQTFASFYANQN